MFRPSFLESRAISRNESCKSSCGPTIISIPDSVGKTSTNPLLLTVFMAAFRFAVSFVDWENCPYCCSAEPHMGWPSLSSWFIIIWQRACCSSVTGESTVIRSDSLSSSLDKKIVCRFMHAYPSSSSILSCWCPVFTCCESCAARCCLSFESSMMTASASFNLVHVYWRWASDNIIPSGFPFSWSRRSWVCEVYTTLDPSALYSGNEKSVRSWTSSIGVARIARLLFSVHLSIIRRFSKLHFWISSLNGLDVLSWAQLSNIFSRCDLVSCRFAMSANTDTTNPGNLYNNLWSWSTNLYRPISALSLERTFWYWWSTSDHLNDFDTP